MLAALLVVLLTVPVGRAQDQIIVAAVVAPTETPPGASWHFGAATITPGGVGNHSGIFQGVVSSGPTSTELRDRSLYDVSIEAASAGVEIRTSLPYPDPPILDYDAPVFAFIEASEEPPEGKLAHELSPLETVESYGNTFYVSQPKNTNLTIVWCKSYQCPVFENAVAFALGWEINYEAELCNKLARLDETLSRIEGGVSESLPPRNASALYNSSLNLRKDLAVQEQQADPGKSANYASSALPSSLRVQILARSADVHERFTSVLSSYSARIEVTDARIAHAQETYAAQEQARNTQMNLENAGTSLRLAAIALIVSAFIGATGAAMNVGQFVLGLRRDARERTSVSKATTDVSEAMTKPVTVGRPPSEIAEVSQSIRARSTDWDETPPSPVDTVSQKAELKDLT